MAYQKFPFCLPAGLFLWGSLYKPDTTDFEGKPLVYKNGPDQGKPRVEYNIGVAIPKDGSGNHWAHSKWGAAIWQAGHAGAQNAGGIEDFSWKITDGDSDKVPKQQPGKPARKAPKDRPYHAGHWIVSLSSSFAPGVVNGVDGTFAPIAQEGAVLPGDLVQISGDAVYNGSQGNPGVFLNHSLVCFSGYSPHGRITAGVDPKSVGFSTGLAAGGVAAPVGGAAAPAPGAGAPPAAPAAGGSMPPPPGGTAAPAPSSMPPPPGTTTAVQPNANFAPPPPGAGAPPAAPARVMLPAANGTTYEAFKDAGWTDEQLIQHGKMAP